MNLAEKFGIDTSYSHKTACPRCRRSGGDSAGDNLHVYGGGNGAYCWACGFTIPSDDHAEEMGWNVEEGDEPVTTREALTSEQKEEIKEMTGLKGFGYRGIRDEISRWFGVRYEYDSETGKPIAQYFPTTIEGELVGYRVRRFPKDFSQSPGKVGKECDLVGQFRFNTQNKICVIVGGETKLLNTYQMLKDDIERRGKDYDVPAVVCSTLGESGAWKQVQAQYAFFEKFEKIIICMDNDKAGKEAAESIAKVLPKGRAYIMSMRYKDADDYVVDKEGNRVGKEREFLLDYWAAKPWTPDGIVGSGSVADRIREAAAAPKVPLPPFMHKLQKLMAGGIPLKTIINLGSASGCVDKDTEYLTPNGWVKFDRYTEGVKVAQYHMDGRMTFVEPLAYIKLPCESMTLVENRSTSQCLTDEHRVIYYSTTASKKPREISFKEVKEKHKKNATGFRGFFATTFTYSGEGVDYSEGELRLQVAVMADGRIVENGADNYTQMRFAKERKYKRLLKLCEDFGLRYEDRGWKPSTYTGGKEYEVIVWPKTQAKSFGTAFYNATAEQLSIICDEVLHWDGSIETGVYTSTREGDVDFLQFAFAACGKRAVVGQDSRVEKYTGGYCGVLNVNKGSKLISIRGGNKRPAASMSEYKTLDGFKYCFDVDTGMLVLRRNGKIFITGNTGKSTIVDECTYYWIFNSPYKPGIVTLESDVGQYGTKLLSRHVGRKIDLFETPEEKLEFLSRPEITESERNLYFKEDGEQRFYLIEDRDGGLDSMKAKIEELVIACGCQLIILDPLQDILDGLPNEEQATFLKWMKGMVKSHDVIFINVNHVRKSQGGKQANSTGADLFEEDMQGSSSIFKSGACNLLFTRNKEAEDPIERNTTKMKASKIRWTGHTGAAGEYYYDNLTHTMYDKEDWMSKQAPATY